MTVTRTHIGSGRALFVLPGGLFLNATKPLAIKETTDERQGARNTNAR